MDISSQITVSKKQKSYLVANDRPTILQVFLNADLRGSHNHLIEIADKYKIKLPELGKNQAVIFINKKQTLMKCYVAGDTFSFTRRDRIDLNAIKHLPEAFGYSGEFDYDKALGIRLEELMDRKKKKELH